MYWLLTQDGQEGLDECINPITGTVVPTLLQNYTVIKKDVQINASSSQSCGKKPVTSIAYLANYY